MQAGVDFEDPNFQTRVYESWIAYGQSKSANALFAVALDAMGEKHGVRAFSVHPGGVVTDLSRCMSADELRAAGATDDQGGPISTQPDT
jgi:NAD(P)-dependent dehydrogenase (short-subunit alcohol dehydrogenase family)